jgi:uridine kinase
VEKLIQQIINWININNKKMVIGISGHGAAGKTTLSNQIVNLIEQNKVNQLNTDPYIISSNIRKNTIIDYTYQNKVHRFKMTACHPSAHHLPSLERDVQMIRDGLDLYTIHTHYKKVLSFHQKIK